MTTFRTRKDVTGFQFRPTTVTSYRGWSLCCVDVSRGHSFGYDFELRAESDEDTGAKLEDRCFAKGVTLHFTDEPNKVGQRGCFSSGWFRDSDVAQAIVDLRAAVDTLEPS